MVAFTSPGSAFQHRADVLARARSLLESLAGDQHADGTFSPGNWHSPPDTAFVVEDLAVAHALLAADRHPNGTPVAGTLADLIARCGPPLVTGGVHTPNHRWALCAALARIDQVRPDPAYGRRIEEWLAEGIDQDRDGLYSERSPNYAARVTNPALLLLARRLDRPRLRDPVARNLAATLACLDPDGHIEAIQSRRQDQNFPTARLGDFYGQLRELALDGADPQVAAAARLVEERDEVSPDVLADLVERPELAAPLPTSGRLGREFVTILRDSGLARIGRNGATASVFGGTDDVERAPEGAATRARRIGSGLSTNPTVLRVCHGAAVLDSVRLSTTYFGLGHFRADRLEALGPGAFRLRDELRVAYHLPLPPPARRTDGDYEWSYDGRYYARMSLDQRPKAYRTLRRRIDVRTDDAQPGDAGGAPGASPQQGALGLTVTFEVDGEEGVPVTIELRFAPGGTVTGARPAGRVSGRPDPDAAVLVDGFASYTLGDHMITFGPGPGQVSAAIEPDPDPGEQYRVHHGSQPGPAPGTAPGAAPGRQGDHQPLGPRVYLTGTTPFRHDLRIRAAWTSEATGQVRGSEE